MDLANLSIFSKASNNDFVFSTRVLFYVDLYRDMYVYMLRVCYVTEKKNGGIVRFPA